MFAVTSMVFIKKQPKMRAGWFVAANGETIEQSMLNEDGEPKGLRRVLRERGLEYKKNLFCKDSGSDRSDCCLRHIMAAQPDFKEQKTILAEFLATTKHICDFLPKFHCELAPIECFWGWAKRYCRANCEYSFAGLMKTVPIALDAVPLPTIRRYFRKVQHLMEAYHQGMGFKLAAFAHQKFKCHRSLPEGRMDEILADMKAKRLPMDPGVVVAASPSLDDDEEEYEDEEEGVDVEHWAMCSLCDKYRKLYIRFPANEDFTCGHDACDCLCTDECDCDDDCTDCPCAGCD